MSSIPHIHLKSMIFATVLTVAILSISIALTSSRVDSSATDNISGYAWSETIGWISMNSTSDGSATGYGVKVATNGDLSGYAWSENIGWISFNASDVGGCPSGTCAPKLERTSGPNMGVVSGWARAVNASTTVNTGGWDGWISLNCANNGACATSDYKVKATDCSWGGDAWGSDVVGWISFGGARGGNVTGTGEGCHPIEYSCVGSPIVDPNASVCSNKNPLSSGVNYQLVAGCVAPNFESECHFVCKSGFVADTATTCRPTQCNNGGDNDGDTLADLTDPGCSNINDDSELGALPTLTLNPRTVDGSGTGGSTVLTWSSGGDVPEALCTLQGGNGAYITPTSVPFTADDGVGDNLYTGTVTVTGIKARTTFTIRCDGQASATVDIVPIGAET